MPKERKREPHMVQLEILDNAPLPLRVTHRPPSHVLKRLRRILNLEAPTGYERIEVHRWLKRYDISIGGLCAVLDAPAWKSTRGNHLPKNPRNGLAEISKWYAGLALEEAFENSTKPSRSAPVRSDSLTVSITGRGPAVNVVLSRAEDIEKVGAILRTYFG